MHAIRLSFSFCSCRLLMAASCAARSEPLGRAGSCRRAPATFPSFASVAAARCSSATALLSPHMCTDDAVTAQILGKDMRVVPDFLTAQEEASILKEIEPYMQRLRYESDHWDDAIHGYRETERSRWNADNEKIICRLKATAFPESLSQLTHIHVLDLSQSGVIKAHVDSVRYCGSILAGMCLLSDAIMRLASVVDKQKYADFLLPRRCLYVMRDRARYEYTHEVLAADKSVFKGKPIQRTRRISVIMRAKPDPQHAEESGPALGGDNAGRTVI